eukprot:CAMPEP_0182598692 /NCGR_PEP_ID=MMETSP1324-20130603/88781_1 /TAXON_ID=236786 /ORGANISM="Florenciella sp., Strain RCC1587" /LENGTH=70 /DNA_ID=CAMNT_0024816543 /DNA_START=84 /DNA_END=292 /DNA_ORIENTATION=-
MSTSRHAGFQASIASRLEVKRRAAKPSGGAGTADAVSSCSQRVAAVVWRCTVPIIWFAAAARLSTRQRVP